MLISYFKRIAMTAVKFNIFTIPNVDKVLNGFNPIIFNVAFKIHFFSAPKTFSNFHGFIMKNKNKKKV
jgi:hypothetical protein